MNGREESENVRPLRDAAWVATVLNTSKGRVYELVRQDILPHVRLGRQVRFDERAILSFIESGGRGLDRNEGAEIMALPDRTRI